LTGAELGMPYHTW